MFSLAIERSIKYVFLSFSNSYNFHYFAIVADFYDNIYRQQWCTILCPFKPEIYSLQENDTKLVKTGMKVNSSLFKDKMSQHQNVKSSGLQLQTLFLGHFCANVKVFTVMFTQQVTNAFRENRLSFASTHKNFPLKRYREKTTC